MEKLNPGSKRKLKSLAHHLKPVVLIGQKGITESLIKAVDKALSDHELIKVKFIDLKDEKRELTEKIVENTGASENAREEQRGLAVRSGSRLRRFRRRFGL